MWSLVNDIFSSLFDPIYSALPLRPHLRETRLVLLESGEWSDPIHCKLEVVALGTQPVFEALSYVWGTSSALRPIYLNGHLINVGANLEAALRRLRSLSDARTLWADAICVNQKNIKERNEQVALMRDIYFECKSVLVWLGHIDGTESQDSAQSLPHEWLTDFTAWSTSSVTHKSDEDNLSEFQARLKTYYKLPFSLRHSLDVDKYMGAYCLLSLLAQNKHVNHEDIPFLLNHDAFHRFVLALSEIMASPWWVRQWVIQEIILPSKAIVHYGKFVAPWDLFARAARNYEHHRTTCCENHYTHLHWNDIRLLEHFSRTIVELDDLRQEWQKIKKDAAGTVKLSLRQLLWQFRSRETSDPRDKIFTLLTLVNYWGKQMAMTPDYNWTTQQIYRATVEKIVAVDESLLIMMGTMEKNLPGVPSWVPDWTRKGAPYEQERLERAELFNASLNKKPEVRFLDESFMEIGGIFFDEIIETSDTMHFDDEDDALGTFKSWYKLVCINQPITSRYPAGDSRLEAYWRTLCMDTCRTLRREGSFLEKSRLYRRCSTRYVEEGMKRWMDGEGLPLGRSESFDSGSAHSSTDTFDVKHTVRVPLTEEHDIQTAPSSEEGLHFIAVDFAITSATMNRNLFFTSKGYMGLGPAGTRKGDSVYVFAGGSMPFVVRAAGEQKIPRNGTHLCHELLGDCYVHGTMDGELMGNYEAQRQVLHLL